MCGIVCAFDLKQKSEDLRPQILEMSKKIRHRGPDWSGIFSDENAILANVNAFIGAVMKAKPSGAKGVYLKRISISSTMGPGFKIDTSSVGAE